MVESHRSFIQPDDLNIKVWRYMDFTKFISILESKALFFSRLDKLGDPFEGSITKVDAITREKRYSQVVDDFSSIIETRKLSNENWRKFILVNCWHINPYESAAMWKLYLKSNEGVAIQTTYKRLIESINDTRKVYIGKINYVDYETEAFADGNDLSRYLHKRKSFEHENEVRAVVIDWPTFEFNAGDYSFKQPTASGTQVTVNINKLIENVYIAPSCDDWFVDLVKSSIIRYQLNFPVIQSNINATPLY